MCGDLSNVFLKKSFSSQSLVLGYVNEFVCQQAQIIYAVPANEDAVPRCQTLSFGAPSRALATVAACCTRQNL